MIPDLIARIKKGEVLLIPSDTTWALVCNATNDKAVASLGAIKKEAGPFVIALPHSDWLSTYVKEVPDLAWQLVDFATEPLTVIYSKGKNVSPQCLGNEGSIALRVIREGVLYQIMQKLQQPLVVSLPGGNGQWADIPDHVKKGVDFVYPDQETFKSKKPSTILQLGTHGEFQFIRKLS
ncbi:MAG: Sua5/YciO/YrdC/YwlC family protein [Cytophagaceae bacterium]|jgi:L-threonylcarbamoyladenylate synthase|nr:Sua5/YciO/YrdC/YwlC family protein [Cytophagaceae bacterium]